MFKTAACNVIAAAIKNEENIIKTCVLNCKCNFFLNDNHSISLEISYKTGQQYGLGEVGSLEQEDLS